MISSKRPRPLYESLAKSISMLQMITSRQSVVLRISSPPPSQVVISRHYASSDAGALSTFIVLLFHQNTIEYICASIPRSRPAHLPSDLDARRHSISNVSSFLELSPMYIEPEYRARFGTSVVSASHIVATSKTRVHRWHREVVKGSHSLMRLAARSLHLQFPLMHIGTACPARFGEAVVSASHAAAASKMRMVHEFLPRL